MPKALRGSYLGLAEPKVIKHIKDLGVTSVQLMPVFAFMAEPRLKEFGLTNYWGYNPISFFAPDPRYASTGNELDAVTEFKTLVREFHKQGLEVILDVVYNHTAEGGEQGFILSVKGLAEFDFYLREEGGFHYQYANYSGCGNTINLDDDYAMSIALESMRYWLTEMQVDGFRFDLAANLGRNGSGFNPRSTLLRAMKQDPIISQAKLIAEPWDIGPNGYQLGHFPDNWLECNDRYRDSVKRYWRQDKGLVAEVASRILGSRDIFTKGQRSQTTSVNYISYHDGYTLHDLVSYEQRHNLANKEENRDGHGANYSRNYGVEGETSSRLINQLRAQQKRNLIATLLFSQGVPHLLAGDEIGRTQQGNNNAYCQDNELSWLNWNLKKPAKDLLAFFKYCIQIRKQHPILQHCFLPDDDYQSAALEHQVCWIRPDGEEKQIEDWHNHDNHCLGVVLTDKSHGYKLLLLMNASESQVDYTLPQYQNTELLMDTSHTKDSRVSHNSNTHFSQKPMSLSLWKLHKSNPAK